MKKAQITLNPHSPLMVKNTKICCEKNDGTQCPDAYALCRCGHSMSQPYCDGQHVHIGFVGTREDSEQPEPQVYKGKDITIVFEPYLCMAAGHCGELEAVFGTHDAPIYNPDGASAQDIITTIQKCPSGALSYIIDGVHCKDFYKATQVVVEPNGPLLCQGKLTFVDNQHEECVLPKADHYTLCRCGGSKKKPLCDGSHTAISFKD